MAVYIIVLLLSILLGVFIDPRKNRRNKILYIFIAMVMLITVSALRSYVVGTDLKDHYYDSFRIYAKHSLEYQLANSPYDVGYIIFYRIVYFFTNNPQWMIALHAIIVHSIIGYFIYKNSEDPRASVFIYITYNTFFMNMAMMRQSMAIAFGLLALEALKNKTLRRKILYICLMIVAISLHSSAIVMLICPILSKIKANKKTIVLIVLISLFTLIAFNGIFNSVSQLISLRKDYGTFYADDIATVNATAILSVFMGVYAIILAYFCLYKNRKNSSKNDSYYSDDHILLLVLIFTVTRAFRLQIGAMARLSECFLPFLWIIIPRSFERIGNTQNKRVLKAAFYVTMIIIFIIQGYHNGSVLYGVVPYVPFWSY